MESDTKTWLEEIKLTEDGGVVKRVYIRGEEEAPEEGDKVHMLYEGRLQADGTVFDKSLDPEQPFGFTLGEGQVIKGWDIGVASMTLGEKAELVLAADYAYGAKGAGASIPPNAALTFMVELVRIGDGPMAARFCKSDLQLFEDAQVSKNKGNEFFKAQQFA